MFPTTTIRQCTNFTSLIFSVCSIDSTNSQLWNNLQLVIPITTIMKPEWMTLWFHLTRKPFFRYSGPWSDNHSSRGNCARYNIRTGKFPAWYHTRSYCRLNFNSKGNEKFEKSWRDLVESQNRQIIDYVEDKIKANEMESYQSRNQISKQWGTSPSTLKMKSVALTKTFQKLTRNI